MGKIRPGNKQNSILNREYGRVKRYLKKLTSRKRRILLKKDIPEGLKEDESKYDDIDDDMN
jgi:glycerol-3-phosphate responsive antiterminator